MVSIHNTDEIIFAIQLRHAGDVKKKLRAVWIAVRGYIHNARVCVGYSDHSFRCVIN